MIITLLSASCSYKPQLTAIPLLEKKGDMQIDGTLAPYALSTSLTASYAFSDYLAVQVFGDVGGNLMVYGHGALGYFKQFNDRLVFENYTGFGYGYSKDTRKDYDVEECSGPIKDNYYLGFTQFNLGENWSRRVHLGYGVGIKIGYLFHVHKNVYYDDYWKSNTFSRKINSTVVEPNIFFRIGGKKLKFSIQLNWCFLRQWNYRDYYLDYFPANIGIGMSYRFSTISKK